MMVPTRRPLRRPNMRRAVILFPSGLTLGNLFFGVFAIIAASRLEFTTAGVYVMLGGICDALDGRVARATNAGTQFGEELDSLVDAITFGLAPGMIMYFAVLNRDGWDWVWVFLFSACAVLRLARFNIEQAGTAKTYFQGLPSPAAGITLASYYWFSQSWLYNYGAIADLKWHVLLRYLMVVLSFLMISNVPYPSFPRTGFRTLRALAATLLVVGSVVLLATRKLEYFFPFALIYVAWGLARWVFSGLFERRQPTLPYDLSEGEDDEDDDDDFELSASQVHATRQRHREGREERPARLAPERPLAQDPKRREPIDPPARTDPPPRRTDRSDRAKGVTASAPSARRETKKDRPTRTERSARVDRADRASASDAGPTGSLLEPSVAESVMGMPDIPPIRPSDEVVSPAVSGAPTEVATPPLDLQSGRKRKRRRRRGERKERSGMEPATGPASTTRDEADARRSSDDVPDSAENAATRSPYAAPAAHPAPPNVAAVPVTPAPSRAEPSE